MKRIKRRSVARPLGTLAVLAWCLPAMGALLNWSGAGLNSNWSNGLNWAEGPLFGTQEGDDIVLDDTTPQPTSTVDSGVPDPNSDGHDIQTLFIGDGMTLAVTGHPLDVNVWIEIEGTVTINCTKVLEGCPDTIIRIGGDQATVLTKKGNSQIVIGRGLCQ